MDLTKNIGTEYFEEDENLIAPDVLAEIGSDTSIYEWLKEDLSEQEFNKLQPTQIVFGMIKNEHETDAVKPHPRPFVCLYKSGNYMVGFQITHVGNKTPACKCPLDDWESYGLRQKSYINIDHEVNLYRANIKFTRARSLTQRDLIGLISFMQQLADQNKRNNFTAKYNIEADIEYLAKYIDDLGK